MFFGKLFFAVAPFLNNSLILADPALSGIGASLSSVHKSIVARANLYLLKRGPPIPPKICSEIVVEPFDDGWPEYRKTFTDLQAR